MNSKKPTALVASACEPTLQIVHEICASAGLHCKLARNALTAAMFLDETTPDLLCVDVDLQTGNGLKFIEALSLAPELARIPTIGFGDQLSGALKNVKTPFTYFIERPVEKLQLLKAFVQELVVVESSVESSKEGGASESISQTDPSASSTKPHTETPPQLGKEK